MRWTSVNLDTDETKLIDAPRALPDVRVVLLRRQSGQKVALKGRNIRYGEDCRTAQALCRANNNYGPPIILYVWQGNVASRVTPLSHKTARQNKKMTNWANIYGFSMRIRVGLAMMHALGHRPILVAVGLDAFGASMERLDEWLDEVRIPIEIIWTSEEPLAFRDAIMGVLAVPDSWELDGRETDVFHLRSDDRHALRAAWVLLSDGYQHAQGWKI